MVAVVVMVAAMVVVAVMVAVTVIVVAMVMVAMEGQHTSHSKYAGLFVLEFVPTHNRTNKFFMH